MIVDGALVVAAVVVAVAATTGLLILVAGAYLRALSKLDDDESERP